MTQLLEKAFAEISKLPDVQQDAYAALLLEKLEDEQKREQTNITPNDLLDGVTEDNLRGEVKTGTKLGCGIF